MCDFWLCVSQWSWLQMIADCYVETISEGRVLSFCFVHALVMQAVVSEGH